MSKLTELTAKLNEILQIDRPDLDFGIYRVINARAGEITDYLARRLPERVREALQAGAGANLDALKSRLADAIAGAQAAGFDPDDAPKVRALRRQIEETAGNSASYENAVYSHLLIFFSRYYDQGDFISQRRYKGDTYAIPYAGEEVVLHWANKDQYYIKSGEAFANYSFRLTDGRLVHFRLVAADTAKDNRKDDKERRFVLIDPGTVTRAEEAGVSSDAVLAPVAEQDGALVLRFAYRPMPQGTKQAELLDRAAETIMADAAVKARWQDLTARAPTEKNPLRTVLQKHLTDYTAKNTADYFIHKDLGGFLRRELDFYIKNEVMNLDDVQNAATFSAIETQLRTIQTLRTIALDLIGFLAQMEDFQKRLWLKKKFVVAAHYCLTLDRVPEALYPAIAANSKQWAQWHESGMRENATSGTIDDLKAAPSLMVDTALFDAVFRSELLKTLMALDISMDGVLVHGDNFQSLSLLRMRYQSQVKSIYIDPPYNTDAGPISYKNGYRSSSWTTMMHDRVKLGRQFLTPNGIFVATIDDYQYREFSFLIEYAFGVENIAGTVVIRMNPSGRPLPQGFAQSHEYAIVARKSELAQVQNLPRSEKQNARYKHQDDDGHLYMWELFRKRGSNSERADRPSLYYPLYLRGQDLRAPSMSYNPESRSWSVYDTPKDDEVVVYPIDESGTERTWRGSPDNITNNPTNYRAKVENGIATVYYKFRPNTGGVLPLTNWTDAKYSATEHGTGYLKNFFSGYNVFSYPKSIYAVEDCLRISGAIDDETVLDYFAGSGTTGHAVINMNRLDGGTRHYILVEQGPYLETITRPRLAKAVYSKDWNGGKPTAAETGISHGFKILKIESYEDTLNNLALVRTPGQASLLDTLSPGFRDDYLLHYMMDVETRGSLLSVRDFRKPFDYKLRIAVDSAGAAEERPVDLLETFNYLIGLTVRTIGLHLDRGFATVTGVLPDRQTALILWRDCDTLDYDGLLELCKTLGINPADNTHDIVYVNGDHIIPTMATADDAAGGGTKTIRIRQIEPVFLDAMFSTDDAA